MNYKLRTEFEKKSCVVWKTMLSSQNFLSLNGVPLTFFSDKFLLNKFLSCWLTYCI